MAAPIPPYPEFSFGFPTQLKRLLDPTDSDDAATKAYVDAQAGGGTFFNVIARTGPLRIYLSGAAQFTVVGRSGNIVVPVQ